MSRDELRSACERVALFPLPNVVFLPHSRLPLHVFEPRYRDLVRDCLAGSGVFAVPLLEAGWEEDYEGDPPVHAVAGVGRILRHELLPDGRYNLILQGEGRVRLLDEPGTDTAYRVARAELLDPPATSGAPGLGSTLGQLRLLFHQLVLAMPAPSGQVPPAIDRLIQGESEPNEFLDMVAHMLLRDKESRQAYIECDRALEQAEMLLAALAPAVTGASEFEA